MKRGGQEIYVGPLGRHSCHLINYFEVGWNETRRDRILVSFLIETSMNLSLSLQIIHSNFLSWSQCMVLVKLKTVTTLQLGCWKSLAPRKNLLWGLILLIFTRTPICIGQFNHISPTFLIKYTHGWFLYYQFNESEADIFKYFIFIFIFQEKQGSDKGIEHPGTWFKGSLLPYSIFAIVCHTMHGLLMETTVVLLAEPALHRREIFVYHFHSIDVWDYVLGHGN